MRLLGWLFLNALIYAASLSEFEYIFWGKIHTDDLLISSEEYHLSRAMQASGDDSEYELICSIAGNKALLGAHSSALAKSPEALSQQPPEASIATARALLAKDAIMFMALNEHKSDLIKCAQAALVKERLSSTNLSAKNKASLSLLPFRFKSEFSPPDLILIYARKAHENRHFRR